MLPTPDRSSLAAEEILDRPDVPSADRDRALRDLDRVNRLLLGNGAVLRTLSPWLQRSANGRPLHLLDIGCGSGSVARQVVDRCCRLGLEAQVTGLDAQLAHLVLGRRRIPGPGRIAAMADGLPFADGSFDWAFSSLFFHHLDEPGNRRILGEMLRVSRCGVAVVDLRAGLWTRTLAQVFLRLLPVGPIARGDGLVSVRRAWSLDRVRRLAGELEVRELAVRELRPRFPCRFSLVIVPAGKEAEPLGHHLGESPPLAKNGQS